MQETAGKPKYNHDLLLHGDDLGTARTLYPAVADALYHPELIAYFKQFDEQANWAKRKSTRLGTWAILLGGTAIGMAAIDVAIRVLAPADVTALLLVGLGAAACGLCSAALGAVGTLFGTRKHQWLINRFMGERTRQFHFQSLIAQLPDILAMAAARTNAPSAGGSPAPAGAEPEARAATASETFMKNRQRRFVAFQTAFEELAREAKFGVTVRPDAEEADWDLCGAQGQFSVDEGEPGLQEFFEAYRDLRLQHQLNFANFKLARGPEIFSNQPARQADLLANVSRFGIQFVIAVHCFVLVIIVGSFLSELLFHYPIDAAMTVSGIFAFAIIALAVISLCAHAFAQGLQPEREVERYQQYGSTISSILTDFNAAHDPTEKIRIMWQMERATFLEMRNFLITHHERSSFAM